MRSLPAALMYNFRTLTNGWWHLDWMVGNNTDDLDLRLQNMFFKAVVSTFF